MTTPKEITAEECNDILENGESTHGTFWVKDGDIYVGVDNTTGDAWTVDFDSLEDCLAWLTKRR